MKQMPLFPDDAPRQHVVNVASVPHRSPFRYPGGKTWLVPYVRRWLRSLPAKPDELVEPFAGGAIIGLTAAFEALAGHVTLAELDRQVAAVWQTIIESDDGVWLAQQIGQLALTAEKAQALLLASDLSLRELALQTIIRNRVNRGGILAPGAGKIRAGENGKGMLSRWYPQTLRKRILDIVTIRDRLSFVSGDGLEVLRQKRNQTNAVFFIDPPYTAEGKKPGKRLYAHSALDHEALFAAVSQLAGDFLITYDENDRIKALAKTYRFETRYVPMKSTHHARQMEMLIGRDLGWLAAPPVD